MPFYFHADNLFENGICFLNPITGFYLPHPDLNSAKARFCATIATIFWNSHTLFFHTCFTENFVYGV